MTCKTFTHLALSAATALGLALSAAAPAAAQGNDFWEDLIVIAVEDLLRDQNAPQMPTPISYENRNYCFGGNVNGLSGDFSRGFDARPINRAGATHYYQRAGNTNQYVGPTGAIYTIHGNGGTATWQFGNQIIDLQRC